MGLTDLFKKGKSNPDKRDQSRTTPSNQPTVYHTPQVQQSTPAPAQADQKRTLKKERFVVSGTTYHASAIRSLAKANPDWRKSGATLAAEGRIMEKIPHYTYVDRPVKLEPEPTNTHDRNAVKVLIAGEHVGYIASDQCVHVGEILRNGEIKYITAAFRGGEYKVVSQDGTAVKQENSVGITLHIGYV